MNATPNSDQLKETFLNQLKKAPIIQVACEKVGIPRSTLYRWRKDDTKFAVEIEEALESGTHIINDLAESQLISMIRKGNMTGIIFWLKSHHQSYANKVEVLHNSTQNEQLTLEQKIAVERVLIYLTGEQKGADDGLADYRIS